MKVIILRIGMWLFLVTSCLVLYLKVIEYLEYSNHSKIGVAKIQEDLHTGVNSTYDYSIKLAYNDSVYYSVLSSQNKIETGTRVKVYFLPKNLSRVKLIKENLIMMPIYALLFFLIALFALIMAYIDPGFILDRERTDITYGG